MAETLLEPVAAGQTRFRMQGLHPDARGIAVGRELLVVFPSLDRLVAFLGAYSDEASLAELLPTMTIQRARRSEGGHAMLLRCAAGDGYALDRVARLVGATRGQLYTGTRAVFVRWRDKQAPFGYDLLQPTVPQGDEVVAVDLDHLGRYRVLDRLEPIELIERLELRPVPLPLAGIARDPDLWGLKDLALVLVAPGLAARVLNYLWRQEVAMAGYYLELEDDRRPSLLLRLRQPRGRVLDVLRTVPGVELLVPVSARAAVQLGYRHPIALPSVSDAFPGEEMFLFRGDAGRVERLTTPPRFIDGRHLVQSDAGEHLRTLGTLRQAELQSLRVSLRIRPTMVPREPRATLVGWDQVHLLRYLVYLLPPSALAASRVAALEEGLLVISGSAVGARTPATAAGLGAGTLIPVGRRFGEVGPGVLVPDGYELWPRIRPTLTRQLLGVEADDHAVFIVPHEDPVRIRSSQLMALDAALMGRLALREPDLHAPDLDPLESGALENDKLGRFALWGFGAAPAPQKAAALGPATPALPPADETVDAASNPLSKPSSGRIE